MIKKQKQIEGLDGKGKHFCIVAARYNAEIVDSLLESAVETLELHQAARVDIVRVPGAFEIPLIVKRKAVTSEYNAILTLACVVRGVTKHYDLVVDTCSRSIAQIMLETGIPITLGILAVDDIKYAKWRARPGNEMNRGRENALAALEMAQLLNDDG